MVNWLWLGVCLVTSSQLRMSSCKAKKRGRDSLAHRIAYRIHVSIITRALPFPCEMLLEFSCACTVHVGVFDFYIMLVHTGCSMIGY